MEVNGGLDSAEEPKCVCSIQDESCKAHFCCFVNPKRRKKNRFSKTSVFPNRFHM